MKHNKMHNIIKKYATDTSLIPRWAFATIHVPTLTNVYLNQQISPLEWILEDDTQEYTTAIVYRYLDVCDSDISIYHPFYHRIEIKSQDEHKYRYIRNKHSFYNY